MILHIILQPEPGKEAEFFEIEPPFDNPEIYTTLDKFREDEFLRLVCDAYQVATGRQVKAYYDRDVEDEDGAFSNVFFEPKPQEPKTFVLIREEPKPQEPKTFVLIRE
jgi:hypothetical protein